ncbi:MAG: hypothetical protein AAF564_15230 [Bacteroidota bacterium]
MKHRNIFFQSLALLLLMAGGMPQMSHAQQSVVVVQIFPPPPNQLTISDLWRVQLNNMGRSDLSVVLRGTVEEAREGLLLDASTREVALRPGLNTFRGPDLEPVELDETNSEYERIIVRTGQAPTGDYTICVYAISTVTLEEVGSDCINHSVELVSPPELIAPPIEAQLSDRFPVFYWTPPAPLPGNQAVSYRIKIVKVLGRQSPLAALQANPSWYEEANLRTTFLQYPLRAQPFESGQYAWIITAETPGLTRGGVALGQSEIGYFDWQPILVLDIADELDIATPTVPGIPAGLLNELLTPCSGISGGGFGFGPSGAGSGTLQFRVLDN